MPSEQILEAVSYLLWAAGFAVLGIGLAAAVVSYRRWAREHPEQTALTPH